MGRGTWHCDRSLTREGEDLAALLLAEEVTRGYPITRPCPARPGQVRRDSDHPMRGGKFNVSFSYRVGRVSIG